MANPIFDLTGKKPADTYRNLVQIDTSSMALVDGSGSYLSASLINMSASYAETASYAIYQMSPEVTSSYANKASLSDQATSASHAIQSDMSLQSTSASFAGHSLTSDSSTSASHALRADNADSASYAGFAAAFDVNTLVTSASHALVADIADSADTASHAFYADSSAGSNTSVSASHADYADATNTDITASWAANAVSASWAPYIDTGTTLYTGSTYEITSSRAVTSSWVPNLYPQTEQLSASWASSSLNSVTSVSSSYASVAGIANSVADPIIQKLRMYSFGDTNIPTLQVEGITSSAAIFTQNSGIPQPNLLTPVVIISRAMLASAPQTSPVVKITNLETGSTADIIRVDARDGANSIIYPFVVDASGSVTASRLVGTASWSDSAVSASYAPTVTVGLTNTTQSWVDVGTMMTQSMYINNGLVISWSVQA